MPPVAFFNTISHLLHWREKEGRCALGRAQTHNPLERLGAVSEVLDPGCDLDAGRQATRNPPPAGPSHVRRSPHVPSRRLWPHLFTSETKAALIALQAERPRWELAFGVCGDGNEWACFSDTLRRSDASFTVAVQYDDSLAAWDADEIDVGVFATAAEVVAALRDAGL